jgi:hypothetical protein
MQQRTRQERRRRRLPNTPLYQIQYDHTLEYAGDFIGVAIVPHTTSIARKPLTTGNGHAVNVSVVSHTSTGEPDCVRLSYPVTVAELDDNDGVINIYAQKPNSQMRANRGMEGVSFTLGNETKDFFDDFTRISMTIDVNHRETRYFTKFENGISVTIFEHLYAGFNGAVYDMTVANGNIEDGGRVYVEGFSLNIPEEYLQKSFLDRYLESEVNEPIVFAHGQAFIRRFTLFADLSDSGLANHYLNFDNHGRGIGRMSLTAQSVSYAQRMPLPDYSSLNYGSESGYRAIQQKAINKSSGLFHSISNKTNGNGFIYPPHGPFHALGARTGGGTGGGGISYTPFCYQCPAGYRWAYAHLMVDTERSRDTFAIRPDGKPDSRFTAWNDDLANGQTELDVVWEDELRAFRPYDRPHGSRATTACRALIWQTGLGIAKEVMAHQAYRYLANDWDLSDAIANAEETDNLHQGEIFFHRDKAWLMDSVASVFRTRYLMDAQEIAQLAMWAIDMASYYDAVAMDSGLTHRAHEHNSNFNPSPWQAGYIDLQYDAGQSYQCSLVSHGVIALYRSVLEGVSREASEVCLSGVRRAIYSLMNHNPGNRPGDYYIAAYNNSSVTFNPPIWSNGSGSEDGWLGNVIAMMWMITDDDGYLPFMETYSSLDPIVQMQYIAGNYTMHENWMGNFVAATQRLVQ